VLALKGGLVPIGFDDIHRREIRGIDAALNTAAATPADMVLANPTLYSAALSTSSDSR